MPEQLNLFEQTRQTVFPRSPTLVMSKKEIEHWKKRIFEHQQTALQSAQTALQSTLFLIPQSTWHSPDDINPFALRQHPAFD